MDPLDHIITHYIMIPGRPGDGMTVAEASALRADIAGYEAQLAAFGLDDLTDVSAASPAVDQVLKWNGTAWVPGAPGRIVQLRRQNLDIVVPELGVIAAGDGLAVSQDGGNPLYGRIAVAYAGTGSSAFAARSDHYHTAPLTFRYTFAPAGYMSSGTRTLVTNNVTLLDRIGYHVKATLRGQIRGADPGACYYRLSVTINGNTRTSGSHVNGFWCVQGVPREMNWSHSQNINGTGAAITVSASVQYDSGGGFYTDAGELEIDLIPRS